MRRARCVPLHPLSWPRLPSQQPSTSKAPHISFSFYPISSPQFNKIIAVPLFSDVFRGLQTATTIIQSHHFTFSIDHQLTHRRNRLCRS
ncbi:hypothetical protein L2E82_44446 [Cichorium intybus]|uniref:Uncharacterized protein n=1 Tax=Cichorium intybus TaxID=13427 RepID=A0ACB8ZR77_CICIN|nr:hypothetical protein L2E82_44446 [Cichorium intybus]